MSSEWMLSAEEVLLLDKRAAAWSSDEFEGTQHIAMRPEELEPLREKLLAQNGLAPHLYDPTTPDFAQQAAADFHRDGFCVVQHCLPQESLAALRAKASAQIRQVLAIDQWGGGKGAHTYMFGVQKERTSMMHHPEWAALVELPVLHTVLEAIFGSSEYHSTGGFGVFTMPGAGYQALHTDGGIVPTKTEKDQQGRITAILPLAAPERPDRQYVGNADGSGFFDPRPASVGGHQQLTARELPVQYLSVGFPIQAMTPLNGPTRCISGTQASHAPIPALGLEPEWMKHATISPVPAGAAIFRDYRNWHGSTANLGTEPRAHPEISFAAPWLAAADPHGAHPEMPFEIWQGLSPRAQHACRFIAQTSVDCPALDHSLAPDLGICFREDYALSAAQIQGYRSASLGGSGTQYYPLTRAEARRLGARL